MQRSTDEMREDDFVRLDPDPYHRRAMLVTMTERGETTYRAASERQKRAWFRIRRFWVIPTEPVARLPAYG